MVTWDVGQFGGRAGRLDLGNYVVGSLRIAASEVERFEGMLGKSNDGLLSETFGA